MATIRDRLGHMFATQRLGSIQYLLFKGNLRPVCWPWVRRSSTASQRAASAARGSDRTTYNPVSQAVRYVGRLLNDVITSGLPTARHLTGRNRYL